MVATYFPRSALAEAFLFVVKTPPATGWHCTGGTAILVQTKAMNYAAGLSIRLASACVINPWLVASSSSALTEIQGQCTPTLNAHFP
jgi:hypothetical protein